jgi:hypothetical protein
MNAFWLSESLLALIVSDPARPKGWSREKL